MSAEGSPAPAEMLLTRRAEPTTARAVRTALRDWLTRWGWHDDDLDDVVIAVDEAVANAVDHAYRLHTEAAGGPSRPTPATADAAC